MPGREEVRDTGTGVQKVFLNKGPEVLLADAAATLTAAAILGGFVRQVPTAARTVTTDTAANIDAALTNATPGDVIEVVVFNNSGGANAITLAAGTGVTLKPASPATIAQNKTATMRFVKTGAAAFDCYVVVSA